MDGQTDNLCENSDFRPGLWSASWINSVLVETIVKWQKCPYVVLQNNTLIFIINWRMKNLYYGL